MIFQVSGSFANYCVFPVVGAEKDRGKSRV